MCCQNASDDEIETEPDLYQCETCPVSEAQAQLWPENAEAWLVFQRMASRFVVDTGLAGDVFRRLTTEHDDDDAVALVERMALLYDIVNPPKAKE